ncbi:ADP-ribosylglycohydrolase family protein [Haloactinopolyspora alba]|nr:ADP-ribosylglycohydrolase family protein [Haloactinopolyspora alba]
MAWTRRALEDYRSRVRGCLLGGAVGDALGAPVEFLALDEIEQRCGPAGVREYLPAAPDDQRYGLVTDDTQMTLFTAEGLIRAGVRTDRGIGFTVAVVHAAYDRWLDTQLLPGPSGPVSGWLAGQSWLYARRAPGTTCMNALQDARDGGTRIARYGTPAVNHSKGCGTVMRSAPFGLMAPGTWPDEQVFAMAAEAAAYTHGHPTGTLAAGTLAVIVARLVAGDDLDAALDAAAAELSQHQAHDETSRALEAARHAARTAPVTPAVLEALGGGWTAHEALAIAVCAAAAEPEPERFGDALALSVTHGGDSDSTGSICGNILGAWHGETALPPALAFEVEGRGTILELADDLVWEFTRARELHGDHGPDTRWRVRYPGG